VTGANINKRIRVIRLSFIFFLKGGRIEGHTLRAVFHSLFLYIVFSIFLSLQVRSESESRDNIELMLSIKAKHAEKKKGKEKSARQEVLKNVG